MSERTAVEFGLPIQLEEAEVELGDKSVIKTVGRTKARLAVSDILGVEEIYLLSEKEYEDDWEPTIIVGRKWLKEHNPHIDWKTGCLHICRTDGTKWTIHPRGERRSVSKVTFKHISLKKLAKMVRKKQGELFMVRVKPELHTMDVADEFKDIVADFDDIFVDDLPNELPQERDVDFEIKLRSNESPPVRPVIRLSVDELKELKRQLQLLLDKGLIRPSKSPYGAPVFFVKNGLRLSRTKQDNYSRCQSTTINQ